ncbi:MAG: GGDEF domain-containing protein, partial [Phycisphaerales bacterium]|nr:GGDEF domain-containing protein [Phycisphaerales bacterium]
VRERELGTFMHDRSERSEITAPLTAPADLDGDSRESALIVIAGREIGKRYPLPPGEYVMGRSTEAGVTIDDPSISRKHARLLISQDGCIIEDLGSSNGTELNDAKIDVVPLRDGDIVRVGNTVLKFLGVGTAENAYHDEIYRITTTDGLTSVYNRRYLLDQIERELTRALRYGRDLSLLMFDVDEFKHLNDTYGHVMGDAVLQELAERIEGSLRRADIFGRYGGEEFCVVVPEVALEGALILAEKVRARVADQPFVVGGVTMHVTVSIGVADIEGYRESASSIPGDLRSWAPDPEQFIKVADAHLYAAKDAGRNRVSG